MSTKLSAAGFYDVLTSTGIPARYSHFTSPQEPPFLVYLGDGQNAFDADDRIYWKENEYRVEFYFKEKSPTLEETIENALINAGIRYEKSEDNWIESEGVFVIYYYC